MRTYYIKGKWAQSVVYDEVDDNILRQPYPLSDNQLEWQSLINAMKMISGSEEVRNSGAEICTDHRLLYKQLIHECRIKANTLRPFFYEYNQLHNELSGVMIAIRLVKDNKARDYL